MTEPQPPRTIYVNPYKDTPNPTRLQTYVSREDYNFIRSVRPNKGTIETTTNLLWHKLCTALKQQNITTYADITKFEQFVHDCTITIPASVTSEPSGKPTRRAARKTS